MTVHIRDRWQQFNTAQNSILPRRKTIVMTEQEEIKKKYGFENPFEPDSLAIKALDYTRNGKHLLDVGCGEGADSVFFANNGFQVVAVDTNNLYLDRLRAFLKDNPLSNISIQNYDVINYQYPKDYYDVVNCLLVGCCMKRSEFEKMFVTLTQTVKPGGLIIMSLRNYLDARFEEYYPTEKMIEPNTYMKKEDCCEIRYFIEKGRLREIFEDFEVLYYHEGLVPDKYEEVLDHGDSHIIARKN